MTENHGVLEVDTLSPWSVGLSIDGLAPSAVIRPEENRTATVLQPGRYGLVRNGRAAVNNPVKYLQNSKIIRRTRMG
jgi:hypothetical protein